MNMHATVSHPSINLLKSSRLTRRPSPLWPKSLKEAEQLAELVFDAKLAPKGFGSPKACLVGILYGMELGLSPMAALQKIALIDGRPTLWGDAAFALVQSSGLLGSFSETIEQQIDPSTNHLRWVATCTLTRANLKDPIIRTFTSDDAKRAGLWQKPGPWSQYPKRMLTIRARAFALRDAFPDILAGLYIREELDSGNMIAAENEDTREDTTSEATETPKFDVEPLIHQAVEPEPHPTEQPMIRRAPPPPVASPIMIPAEISQPEPLLEDELDRDDLSATTQPANHTQLIDDFDHALCCAFDTETLEEIREEFQPKIDTLGSDFIAHAGRIFLRHEQRIEDINSASPYQIEAKKYPAISTNNREPAARDYLSQMPKTKARRHTARASPSLRRRPLSLLALHARQRLSASTEEGVSFDKGAPTILSEPGNKITQTETGSQSDQTFDETLNELTRIKVT